MRVKTPRHIRDAANAFIHVVTDRLTMSINGGDATSNYYLIWPELGNKDVDGVRVYSHDGALFAAFLLDWRVENALDLVKPASGGRHVDRLYDAWVRRVPAKWWSVSPFLVRASQYQGVYRARDVITGKFVYYSFTPDNELVYIRQEASLKKARTVDGALVAKGHSFREVSVALQNRREP